VLIEHLYRELSQDHQAATLEEIQQRLRRSKFRRAEIDRVMEKDFRFRRVGDQWRALPLEEIHGEALLPQTEFVVVDLETTGGDPSRESILEVGALRVRDGRELARFSTLVHPGKPVPAMITAITGITDSMVRHSPVIGEVLPMLAAFTGRQPLLAHNAPFDMGFLREETRRLDRPPIQNPVLCTLKLSRKLWPEIPRKGLDGLIDHFGLEVQDRHRALGDCLVTAQVFSLQMESLEARRVATLHQLFRYYFGMTAG